MEDDSNDCGDDSDGRWFLMTVVVILLEDNSNDCGVDIYRRIPMTVVVILMEDNSDDCGGDTDGR